MFSIIIPYVGYVIVERRSLSIWFNFLYGDAGFRGYASIRGREVSLTSSVTDNELL